MKDAVDEEKFEQLIRPLREQDRQVEAFVSKRWQEASPIPAAQKRTPKRFAPWRWAAAVAVAVIAAVWLLLPGRQDEPAMADNAAAPTAQPATAKPYPQPSIKQQPPAPTLKTAALRPHGKASAPANNAPADASPADAGIKPAPPHEKAEIQENASVFDNKRVADCISYVRCNSICDANSVANLYGELI